MRTNSSLSTKRIVLTLCLFSLTPLIRITLSRITGNETIASTMAFNLVCWAMIIYDWNLFALHWNRFKSSLGDGILYTVVGLLLIGCWTTFSTGFLQASIPYPDKTTLLRYSFAMIPMLIAFSFCQAVIINICFKCLTDHIDVRGREIILILLSGFLFGTVYTVSLLPMGIALFMVTLLYHIVLVAILSYLYNQSNSFMPGIFSLSLIMAALSLLQLQ